MQALKFLYVAPEVSGTNNLTNCDHVTATQAGSGLGRATSSVRAYSGSLGGGGGARSEPLDGFTTMVLGWP